MNDDAKTETKTTSVIAPVYNEAENIAPLYDELTETLSAWGRPYELVFVDDGSTDGSGALLDALAEKDPRVTVVHFRRNYGQTAALTAGIDEAVGGILVPIDADLQNDPRDVPALVAKLDDGYDVVSGWRKNRQDKTWSRVLPSRAANWLISTLSGVRLHDYGCSLKAYRREVIEDVRLYGEMHRFIPVYAHMQGGRVAELVVNHRARRHGLSKYGLGRIYKVLLDLLLVKFLMSYASKPIYVFGGFGLLCLAGSLLPIVGAVYFKIQSEGSALQKDFVETPLPVAAAVLILVGFLALLQGLLAEMLMRTYFESQGKRPYVVQRVVRRATPPDEAS
ncbi:MAG: glycosyltransferase family 2 protein [Planctomycetia bacterium]